MSLEIRVAELTTETTNLLDAVNVKKQALDDSVESASSSASSASSSSASASSSATTAQNAEGQTLIYRDEAKQHRDDAAAVVTGGTAALEPEPGKIPLADSAGRMDHRWLGGEYIAHLMGAVSGANDLAGSTARQLEARISQELAEFLSVYQEAYGLNSIVQIVSAISQVSDVAAQAARMVSGGEITIRDGRAQEPSISRKGDRDTGLFFPGEDAIAAAVAGVEALRIDPAGRLGIGTTAPSSLLDVNDDKVRVRNQKTPASATDSGNAGEIAWDADYIYVCTATNTWKRAALTTW